MMYKNRGWVRHLSTTCASNGLENLHQYQTFSVRTARAEYTMPLYHQTLGIFL